jgi:hypothetical protein
MMNPLALAGDYGQKGKYQLFAAEINRKASIFERMHK